MMQVFNLCSVAGSRTKATAHLGTGANKFVQMVSSITPVQSDSFTHRCTCTCIHCSFPPQQEFATCHSPYLYGHIISYASDHPLVHQHSYPDAHAGACISLEEADKVSLRSISQGHSARGSDCCFCRAGMQITILALHKYQAARPQSWSENR